MKIKRQENFLVGMSHEIYFKNRINRHKDRHEDIMLKIKEVS